jgi:DNA-binding winged helix-turn-helix (wHTH) protein
LPKPTKHPCGIEIVRGMPGPTKRDAKLLLYINGRFVEANRKQLKLLACLYDNLGHLVSYERLCLTLGYKSTQKTQRHRLRQYAYWIKKMLTEYQAPCVLTVCQEVGYALCEIAKE